MPKERIHNRLHRRKPILDTQILYSVAVINGTSHRTENKNECIYRNIDAVQAKSIKRNDHEEKHPKKDSRAAAMLLSAAEECSQARATYLSSDQKSSILCQKLLSLAVVLAARPDGRAGDDCARRPFTE